MAQTRPSPTLSRGFTRLGRFLAPYGKLLESETLQQQATNNTKEQFANSPDLKNELLNAIMGALDAHNAMSTQALNAPAVQSGMTDILLNHARLWETLRERVAGEG